MSPIILNKSTLWGGAPTTQRICLPFEQLKDVCMNVPTIEGVKLALVRLHREILVKHPYISAACLLFVAFFPTSPFYVIYYPYAILCEITLGFFACLGFERRGVRAGSAASWYQSNRYGGHTPSNSFFAHSQSYGAVQRNDGYHEDQAASGSTLLKWVWRIIGFSCAYAAIVVLLKYGGTA